MPEGSGSLEAVDSRTCPFAEGSQCRSGGCMAWDDEIGCRLMPLPGGRRSFCDTFQGQFRGPFQNPFQEKLRPSAPLMFGTLLDLVKIMEKLPLNAKDVVPTYGGRPRSYNRQVRPASS